MVRQIRHCTICSQRFIALHSTHVQCCTAATSTATTTSSNNSHRPNNKRKTNGSPRHRKVVPSLSSSSSSLSRSQQPRPNQSSGNHRFATTTTNTNNDSIHDQHNNENDDNDNMVRKTTTSSIVHRSLSSTLCHPMAPTMYKKSDTRTDIITHHQNLDHHHTDFPETTTGRKEQKEIVMIDLLSDTDTEDLDPTNCNQNDSSDSGSNMNENNKLKKKKNDTNDAGDVTVKSISIQPEEMLNHNNDVDYTVVDHHCDNHHKSTAAEHPPIPCISSEAEDDNDSIDCYIDDDDDDDDDNQLLLAELLWQHPKKDENPTIPKEGNIFNHHNNKVDQNPPRTNTTATTTTTTALDTDPPVLLPMMVQNATTSTSRTTANDMICWICGTNLTTIVQRSGRKGRVQHMKRCSKNHNVALQDLIDCDDEKEEEDYDTNDSNNTTGSNVPSDNALMDTTILSKNPVPTHGAPKNPYTETKQHWHDHTTVSPTSNKNSSSSSSSTKKDVNHLLMAGARRNAKIAEIQKMFPGHNPKNAIRKQGRENAVRDKNNNGENKRQRRYQSGTTTTTTTSHRSGCPKYKMIPGTDFVCDGFHYANVELSKNYFLTHFHSDHYGGINKQWNVGTIYCSVPTANLVHSQLGVSKQYIHPLPLFTPTIIASHGPTTGPKAITVTLLNANHCPGAIMFLFEVGTRVILHVGDFRWNYHIMSQQQPLRPFCRIPWTNPQQVPQSAKQLRRIDDLFLDTTYCDAQYDLPTQEECIQAVIDVVQKEIASAQSKKANIILLFGAYTIGKEAVYMSVAKHLNMKVYVDQRRYRILSSLEWSKEEISILTTNPELTNIWVVPLGHINMSRMTNYQTIQMKNFYRNCDRVIGFRPTGWTLQKKGGTGNKANTSIIGMTTKGCKTLYTVPYSEHSSFPELVECLESLNPKRIIPTVNTSKSQQQIDLLMTHWRMKQEQLFLTSPLE